MFHVKHNEFDGEISGPPFLHMRKKLSRRAVIASLYCHKALAWHSYRSDIQMASQIVEQSKVKGLRNHNHAKHNHNEHRCSSEKPEFGEGYDHTEG